MPPSRPRPSITVATHQTCSPTVPADDSYLSSLSPASLSTTLSSAAYYSTPQVDGNMDISDEEFDATPHDAVRIKHEGSPEIQFAELRGFPSDSPPLVSPSLSGKRKVGRPPKNKTASSVKEPKKTKVNERSKTGCMTCRKRKKKCDETRPKCNNCTKTNYECEGYQPTRSWQPSTNRLKKQNSSNEDMKKLLILPPQPRTYLFPGIENELDARLLEHFTEKTCRTISLFDSPDENPWIRLVLPIAKDYSCVMHSILALSAAHLQRYDEQHSCVPRRYEHATRALEVLRGAIEQVSSMQTFDLPKHIIAALMINCLIHLVDGATNGEYQLHLSVMKDHTSSDDDEFGRFTREFYKHYEFCKTLTSLPPPSPPGSSSSASATSVTGTGPGSSGGNGNINNSNDIIHGRRSRPDFHLEYFERRPSNPSSPAAGLMLSSTGIRVGVLNGEFLKLVSDVTHLRDRVRVRHLSGQRPAVDPLTFSSAARLDEAINQWNPAANGDMDEGLHEEGTSAHVAAQIYKKAAQCYLSRTIHGARDMEMHATRVEHGVQWIRLLPADNPAMCTVLLPTFIIGCAAFREEHRAEIRAMLDRLERYSRMGNIRSAREVLERVWRMMDDGDEANWDWETVMAGMGIDVLIG